MLDPDGVRVINASRDPLQPCPRRAVLPSRHIFPLSTILLHCIVLHLLSIIYGLSKHLYTVRGEADLLPTSETTATGVPLFREVGGKIVSADEEKRTHGKRMQIITPPYLP